MPVAIDERMWARATAPRYSFVQAAELVGTPEQTVRRWSVGNRRGRKAGGVFDEPLIAIDGGTGRGALPVSFANLVELRALREHRENVPLQAIRSALAFAARELDEPRPLLTDQFVRNAGELWTIWAMSRSGRKVLDQNVARTPGAFVNASRGGQLGFEQLIESVSRELEYPSEFATRWWPYTQAVPILVDTAVATGLPITRDTGTRTDAIASRIREGFGPQDITDDTGATPEEVAAVFEVHRPQVA